MTLGNGVLVSFSKNDKKVLTKTKDNTKITSLRNGVIFYEE